MPIGITPKDLPWLANQRGSGTLAMPLQIFDLSNDAQTHWVDPIIPAGQQWTAVNRNADAWFDFTPKSGTGPAPSQVQVDMLANVGPDRVGYIDFHTFAGVIYTQEVRQGIGGGGGGDSSCTWTGKPSSIINVSSMGDTALFTVKTQIGCKWWPTTADSWLHVTPSYALSSNNVRVVVDANPDPIERTGTVTINKGTGGSFNLSVVQLPDAGPVPASCVDIYAATYTITDGPVTQFYDSMSMACGTAANGAGPTPWYGLLSIKSGTCEWRSTSLITHWEVGAVMKYMIPFDGAILSLVAGQYWKLYITGAVTMPESAEFRKYTGATPIGVYLNTDPAHGWTNTLACNSPSFLTVSA